jgi:hypothetical protein
MTELVKQTLKIVPKEELDKYPKLDAKHIDIREYNRKLLRLYGNTVIITSDGKKLTPKDII